MNSLEQGIVAKAIDEAISDIRLAMAELDRTPDSVAKANVELFLNDALQALGVKP